MALKQLPKLYSTDFRLPNKKPVGDVEIDWSNSLSDGLVFDVEMQQGSGSPSDLVTGRLLTSNGQGWAVAKDGYGRETTYVAGLNNSVNFTGLEKLSGSSHTIHIRTRVSAFDVSGLVICGWNNNGLHFWQVDDTLSSVFIGGSSTPGSNHEGATDNYRDWFFYSDGPSNSRGFYENGVLLNAGASSVTLPSGSKSFQLGKWASSNSFSLSGGIVFCRIWNRKLKDPERISLLKGQIPHLKPKAQPVYFTADAGGTITVNGTLGTISYSSQTAVVGITGSVDIIPTLGTISYASQDAVVGITGAIDVTATLGTISYSSQNTTVSITGTIDAISTLGTISYDSQNTVVGVTGGINATATLGTINYAAQNTSVSITGVVDVTATLGSINYTSQSPIVSIGGVVLAQATLGTITYTSQNTTVSLTGVVSVSPTLGTISYESSNAIVDLAGLIDVNATLGTISYTSNNTTVTVQAGQAFGVVTASFADDLYTSGFKPDQITVNFKT